MNAGVVSEGGVGLSVSETVKELRSQILEREREKQLSASRAEEDSQYLERVKRGEKEAFRYLVEKYKGRAYSIALSVLKSRDDAEDIVQEAFVKTYLSLADFRGDSAFYTWFYRIVYNMAVDYQRKLFRRQTTPVSELTDKQGVELLGRIPDTSPESSPQETYLRRQQAQGINEALQQLSEEHRTVIMLREVDGLNYDEIANVVGVSKGTIMSRLHYARKKLQQALGEFAPEGSPKPGIE